MTENCFDISGVSFSYGPKRVIQGITHEIAAGKFYGILGPNGCGKSTLLDLLIGHQVPQAGTIRLRGVDIRELSKPRLARQVALVSQNFYINFPYTVTDVVMMGRYPHMPRFSSPAEKDFQIIEQVMELTGVNRFRNRLITELSGGERQRTVFARALAQETDVLLLDEATSNLDIRHTLALLDVVREKVRTDQITVVSVFQDINLAAVYCDEMLFMKEGAIVAGGPSDTMMTHALLEEVFQVGSEIRYEPLYQAKQAVFKSGGVNG